MTGLFIALGMAILTLIVILLWYMPHLLQQHWTQVTQESAQLREMIGEMINEHEAVSMRQVQLGTSISYLQDQLEQIITINVSDEGENQYMLTTTDPQALAALESRVASLQNQIDRYVQLSQMRARQDSESWVHLLSLLDAIQERIRYLPNDLEASAHLDHTRNGHKNSGYDDDMIRRYYN